MRVWLLLIALAACGEQVGPDGIRSGSRLRAKFLEDADGVRSFQGFHDNVLDADCSFLVDDPSDVARCMPPIDGPSAYLDPGCTQPVLEVASTTPSCSPLPSYIGVGDGEACSNQLAHVWKLGATIHPTQLYGGSPGRCIAIAVAPADTYYGIGDEVNLDTFVGARLENVGDHRMQDRVIVADDGARMMWSNFDRELGVECYPSDTVCLPDISSPSFFDDSGCSEAVVASVNACVRYQSPYVGEYNSVGCETVADLYELGAPITPTALYSGEPGSCSPMTIPPDTTFWSVGASLPSTAIISLAQQVDPDATGRLAPYDVTTADGYRLSVPRYRDKQLDVDCFPLAMSGGKQYCAPWPSGWTVSSFSDAQCQTAVDVVETAVSCDRATPSTALSYVAESPCAGHYEVYQVGAEIASGTIYTMNGGVCTPSTWDTTQERYFVRGAQIPDSTYVELDPTTD